MVSASLGPAALLSTDETLWITLYHRDESEDISQRVKHAAAVSTGLGEAELDEIDMEASRLRRLDALEER